MKLTKHIDYVAGVDSVEKTRDRLAKDQHLVALKRHEIQQLQESRLREMLKHAIDHSAWYREKFKHIDVANFKLTDLSTLPTMNKRDLMDHWDDIVTDKRLKFKEAGEFLLHQTDYDLYHGTHLFASGGSSGRRGMYVWSADEIAIVLAGMYRYQYRDEYQHAHRDEQRRVVSVAALKPVHLSETVLAFPIDANMTSLALSASAPLDDLVTELNAYQPTHLNGYPSVIGRLAHQALEGKLAISPKRIMVGAEPLLDHMVQAIKKAWPDVVLCNQWGSTDAGVHAVSCDYSDLHLHLIEDLVIIEPVDEHHQPVPAGTTAAKIFVTNLYRKSMPVFRYEMEDAITIVDSPCRCGSNYQLISSILGRHEHDFIYNDILVVPEVFENAIMPDPAVDEYQVIQTANGAKVLIVPIEDKVVHIEKMQSLLVQQLAELGLQAPSVDIQLVQALERHPETSKLVRFKPL